MITRVGDGRSRINGTASLALAFAVLVGACSGDDGASSATEPASTTTAPTGLSSSTTSSSTTSFSTTTSSSTTTTSTLPPGLQPQPLGFGFVSGGLAKYDASREVGVSTRLASTSGGVLLDGAGSGTFSHTMRGKMWQYVAPGPNEEAFEVIYDFRPSSGSIAGEINTFSYTETLDGLDLERGGGIVAPLILDRTGRLVDGGGGAPWFWSVGRGPLDSAALIGPSVPHGPMDVGDAWHARRVDPAFGTLGLDAVIVGEVPLGDGFGFEVEYSGTADRTPVEMPRSFATDLLATADSEQAPGLLAALSKASEATVEAVVTDLGVDGRYVLEPSTGQVHELDSTVSIVMTLDITEGDETTAVIVTVTSTWSMTLDEAIEAEGFERQSVLKRFGIEAEQLTKAGFAPLAWYELIAPDDDDIEYELSRFDETPGVVGPIYYAQFGNGEQTVYVFGMVGTGRYRAAPILGEGLAATWKHRLDNWPRWTWIDGQLTFKINPNNRRDDWTVWADETYVFAVIGDNPLRDEVISVLMAGLPDGYVWETGDCFDFTDDFGSELPWAPFGPLGLRHCNAPHTWEVLATYLVEEGENVGYPADIDQRTTQACGEVYFERFESPPLEQGIDLVVMLPDREEWEDGRRYGVCVIAQYDTTGSIVSSETRIAQEDVIGSYDVELGDCLVGSTYGVTPVPCSISHRGEVVGTLTYESDDGPPDPSAVRNSLRRACERELGSHGVTIDWRVEARVITDMYVAWDQGVREYHCVGVVMDQYFRPQNVKGSILGDWEFADDQVGA